MAKESICKDARARMEKVVMHLQDELRGLRTGRASPGLVENIKVECYGDFLPLKQMAVISTPDAQSITIKPYDTTIISSIEKAILQSDLGLTPSVEGKAMRTKDDIQKLIHEYEVKLNDLVKKKTEEILKV